MALRDGYPGAWRVSEQAQLRCRWSISPLGPVGRCGLRQQQRVEVGKNKLFSRRPLQLLLSKLSQGPNKQRGAGAAASSAVLQAQPILSPQPSEGC